MLYPARTLWTKYVLGILGCLVTYSFLFMKPFSKKEAFTFAWGAFKKDPWFLMGVTVIVFAASALGSALSSSAGVLGVVFTVASILLQWWLYLGFTRIALALYAGQPVTWKMLVGESWETLYRFALAAILAAIFVMIGFVLLVVPGFIVQTMLMLFMYTVLDKHMGPVEALKESKRLTKGSRWNLFFLLLILMVFNIIGAAIVGLGLLVTMPMTMLILAYVYRKLDRRDDMVPSVMTPPPPQQQPPQPVMPSHQM